MNSSYQSSDEQDGGIAVVDNLIEVESVSVQFGTQWVLRDISLSIARGQTVSIIGESGCGKTVFMKRWWD